MKILYYDCFAGISGDMNLAAMIDLGIDEKLLKEELAKLALGNEFELLIEKSERYGLTGTKCTVITHEQHHHRHLGDIDVVIDSSKLDDEIKKCAKAIFRRVAKAEARVHGMTIDEVHFHEVGGMDSIIDIVGAAICFHHLGVDAVWSSVVELGGGFVNCAHGKLPVPAPATALITEKIPTRRNGVQQEATTPTGAAIVAELVDLFPENPAMSVISTGYGIGHRDNGKGEIVNALRVHLAEIKQEANLEAARLLECNIDDMTGEALGFVMEKMMQEGAMDCHFSPIQMKKNRPGICISVLCGEDEGQKFKELLFRHTTTLGIKSIPLEKTVLTRRSRKVETSLGKITLKDAMDGKRVIRSKPEFDECRKLAEKHGLPLAEIYKMIEQGNS